MKIGVVYPQTELKGDPEALRQLGLATEELGYDHLLMYDHVVGAVHADRDPPLWGPYQETDPFHDPLVAFGYLAGITQIIELVTGVLILPQRQTALVAKQATDLDLLSGERLRLGVGTGWNYVEYDALGQDFAVRGPRIDEQVAFLRQLWTEAVSSFDGEYDHLDRGNINIRPNRQIPIWFGGFSEPAFRRAGATGDGFIFAGPLEGGQGAVGGVLDGWIRIKEHLQANDRSVSGFGADYVMLASRSVDETLETLKRWEDAGGTHASVVTMGMNLGPAQAHIDYIADVKSRL